MFNASNIILLLIACVSAAIAVPISTKLRRGSLFTYSFGGIFFIIINFYFTYLFHVDLLAVTNRGPAKALYRWELYIGFFILATIVTFFLNKKKGDGAKPPILDKK
jgi:hypothetical protein